MTLRWMVTTAATIPLLAMMMMMMTRRHRWGRPRLLEAVVAAIGATPTLPETSRTTAPSCWMTTTTTLTTSKATPTLMPVRRKVPAPPTRG